MGDTIVEMSRSAAQNFKDGMNSTVGTVKHGIADTIGQAGDVVRGVPNPIPSMKQNDGRAQSALSDLLEKQPLVLGAVAFRSAPQWREPFRSAARRKSGPAS